MAQMTRDELTDTVNNKIDRALEFHSVEADYNGATVLGTADNERVFALVTFDTQTTAREVASVRQQLPIHFDKTIDFDGGNTLMLKVEVGI